MNRKKPPGKGTNAADLMRYDVKRFDLIPLHRPCDVMTTPNGTKKEVGKAPRDAKWTTKTYDSAKVRADAIEEKRNVGVRLTDELLVIDVDRATAGKRASRISAMTLASTVTNIRASSRVAAAFTAT
jgi:hypothetical protein